MLSVLCIGDVHIQTGNILQIKEFLSKLEELLVSSKYEIDIIILMGDILHTHERLHTTSLNYATQLFKMVSSIKPTYVLVGNHDLESNSQFLTTNHWMNCFKNYENLTIVDKVTVVEYGKIKITLCPYVPDGKFNMALETHHGKWEDSKCIFAHQLFDGAKMGAIVAENVEKWDENMPFVISGHIHDKQLVQPNLYYTGSCMQHAFGESHDKTILLVNIHEDIKHPLYTEIDLCLRKKKIIYTELEEFEKFDISTLEKNTEYKITIDGSYEEFNGFRKTARYKELIKRGLKIVFKQKRSFILDKKEQMKERVGITKETSQKSFNQILEELISQEKNSFLDNLFDTIVMNQVRDEINEIDDIIVID